MATTTPDEIWTPDGSDEYALTVDLAATADSIQDALNRRTGQSGSTAERTAYGASAQPGATFYDTTLDALFVWSSGVWQRIAPQTDTGWVEDPITLLTGFSGDTRARIVGDLVEIRGVVTAADNFRDGNTQIGTLPAMYRPGGLQARGSVHFSGGVPGALNIGVNGTVSVARGYAESDAGDARADFTGLWFLG